MKYQMCIIMEAYKNVCVEANSKTEAEEKVLNWRATEYEAGLDGIEIDTAEVKDIEPYDGKLDHCTEITE